LRCGLKEGNCVKKSKRGGLICAWEGTQRV